MTRKTTRRNVLAAALAAAACGAAAQSRYPDRPIRLVIPFPPGGIYDAVGRPLAERLKSTLGTVVVENIGGAGGSLGTATVARAPTDGYTLLLGGGGPLVLTPIVSSRPTYDPLRDLAPIAMVVTSGLAIVVHPSLTVATLPELVAHARANRGRLSYGSAGVGTVNQLTGELLKVLTETPDILHVPYKGAGPAITDLVSGQIPMAVLNVTGQLIALHRSGKLRILAVTAPRRLVAAPEIPTAVETGLAGLISQNFIGLLAPAGTAAGVIAQVADATRAVLADAGYRESLAASGFEPHPDAGPAEAHRFLAEEIARWRPVVAAIGLRLD